MYNPQIKPNLSLGYLMEDHLKRVKQNCPQNWALQHTIFCIEFGWSVWFISTNCSRYTEYDLNQKFVIPLIPYEFNLFSIMLWFMTWCAFVKSNNIATDVKSYSQSFLVKDRVAVADDLFSFKSFWASIDIFLLQLILTCYKLTSAIFLEKPIKLILVYNSVHHVFPSFL